MTDWAAPNSEYRPPKPGEPPLHAAARVGDPDKISSLVAAGTAVDALFEIQLDPGARAERATALMVAAGSNDGATVETVQLLLDLGASPGPGLSGVSALWYACSGLGWNYPLGGDAPRVAALLEAGADPNVSRPNSSGDQPGVSALARASSTGDATRVEMLLDAGADPDPAGGRPPFELPLYQAAESGSGACVSLLLKAGADPMPHFDGDEDPPIASAGSVEVLEALLEAGANPNAPCTFGNSVAGCLSRQPIGVNVRIEMLRILINRGIDINQVELHSTPLASAAMNANQEAVEVLLNVGADPLSEPNALGFACFLSFDERHDRLERVIELLIDAGVDPNEPDENGLRPLHAALAPYSHGPGFASSDGVSVAATTALLQHGTSIDITFPGTGYRPLHAAAAAGSDELVSLLIETGADVSERTAHGLTPAEVAAAALEQLSNSEPTIALARTVHNDEARAEKRLRQFQRDHNERVERTRRCVELLAISKGPGR